MRKEIDKRQKIESGGLPVTTVAESLSLLLTVLPYPNQKGRAQGFHDTKNKQV